MTSYIFEILCKDGGEYRNWHEVDEFGSVHVIIGLFQPRVVSNV